MQIAENEIASLIEKNNKTHMKKMILFCDHLSVTFSFSYLFNKHFDNFRAYSKKKKKKNTFLHNCNVKFMKNFAHSKKGILFKLSILNSKKLSLCRKILFQ